MNNVTKGYLEIGLFKELRAKEIITEEQLNLAIQEVNKICEVVDEEIQ